MGDVAEILEVSVPYISDVERGNRLPLSRGKIEQVSAFLGVDSNPLHIAAAESRGSFELPLTPKASPSAREVGAALMRRWDTLSDEDFEAIHAVLTQKQRQ